MNPEKIRAMLVLDSKLSKRGIFQDAKKAIFAGIPSLQYRDKEKSARAALRECIELKKICGKKALFFVNDRADLALACNAGGLHLGQGDLPVEIAKKMLPNAIIGVSIGSVKEAIEAEKAGADYVSVSPVFETSTKKDAGKGLGIETVKAVKKAVNVPVMGIGGINAENAREVIKAGADGIAVVSCIACSDNAFKASKQLLEAIK